MRLLDGSARDAAEDVYFGQVVLVWGRWFVILAAAVLALWSTTDTAALAGRSLLVVGLMAVNFYLHGRTLMEKPANERLLLAASAIDLLVAGAIVATWGDGGLESQLSVLYYPLLFGFALVFAPRLTTFYAAATLGSYAAICLLADPSIITDARDAKLLATRLITFVATAGLGTFYWRIQRARRREAAAAPFAGLGVETP